MLNKIIFRADGNREFGLGHLYRLFSVMDMIEGEFSYTLITKENSSTNVIPDYINYSTIPSTWDSSEEIKFLVDNYPPNQYILIADGYHFDSYYQRKIKASGYKLIYIDDLTTEHMYADIVINHCPHYTPSNFITEKYTKLALGLKYALLRKEFIKPKKRNVLNRSLLICFGGGDKDNLSFKVAKSANELDFIEEINIILGGAASKEELELFNWNKKVTLYQNLVAEEMVEVIRSSFIAVVPSSTILLELMSIGVPSLSGFFVDNQKRIYSSLKETKAFFGVEDMNKIDWTKALVDFIKTDLNSYIRKQKELIDHKSNLRIKSLIKELSFIARNASKKDCDDMYKWSNDTLVRKNSFYSEPISYESHVEWFNMQLNSNDSEIYFIEDNNQEKIGVVRFSIKDNLSLLSVNMNPKLRGMGYGAKVLELGCEKYFMSYEKPIKANIKLDNKVSHRIFIKNGFIEQGEEIINEIPSKFYFKND